MPTAQPSGRPPWYAWPLVPFAFAAGLIVVLPLGILALMSIPFSLLMVGLQSIGESRIRRGMKARGRFIEWADLSATLTAGEGTLIIEQANKCPIRVWWTPDDVLSLAPCPPPGEDEMDILGIRPKEPHEFVSWCHRRYIDEQVGAAMLTCPALELPPGLFFARFFEERFPRITAVDTVYCWGGGGWPGFGCHATPSTDVRSELAEVIPGKRLQASGMPWFLPKDHSTTRRLEVGTILSPATR